MSSEKKPACSCSDLGTGEVRRRGFIGLLLGVIGVAIAFVTPIYASVRAVIFPLSQKSLSGKEYLLTTIDLLDETTPQRFPIVDDVVDAWVTIPQRTIGNVYVRKISNTEVLAWQALCPHAGCVLGVKTTENPKTKNTELLFACPCHVAHFDLDGNLLDAKPDTPRNMDSLEARVEDGKVYVKFQDFQFGVATKTPA